MSMSQRVDAGIDKGSSRSQVLAPSRRRCAKYMSAIVLILFITTLLAACQRTPGGDAPVAEVTVVEIAELPTITIGPGEQLPLLPEQVDVVYSNGTAGRLKVFWDVAGLQNQRLWGHTEVKGTVVDKNEALAVSQRIEVIPNREVSDDAAAGIIPASDPMAGLERLKMEWSGTEISEETREELRAVLFRDKMISAGATLGGFPRCYSNEYVVVNGFAYCLATDDRFPTYAHFMAFLKATYTGRLLNYYVESDLCIEVDGKLYCRPDGAGSVEGPSGPTRMKVLEANEQKMTVECSVTMVGPGWSHVDVKQLEFLFVDGRWLMASYGFEL